MAGKYLRGAFVEYMPTFATPIPNVIIFQYNPETISHNWSAAQEDYERNYGGWGGRPASGTANPLAVRGMPSETFSFSLAMNAEDQLAEGDGLAGESGIYSRLAALEMLLYPVPDPTADGGGERAVSAMQLPTVLFVWGAGRILPVRVNGLSITERLYDVRLNPTYAEAQIDLRVLTPDELEHVQGPLGPLARTAYEYSQSLRQGLAVANLANAAESFIGMIPV